MTADLWGLGSIAAIAAVAAALVFLPARVGLLSVTIAALVFCLFSFAASILVLPPDFGGGMLLLIGLGLGVGLGAFVELAGKTRTENWFALPPAFVSGGVLLLSAIIVHSPDVVGPGAMGPGAQRGITTAVIAGIIASWVIGRALANVLHRWLRFLPVLQTRSGLLLNAGAAAIAILGTLYALLSAGNVAFVIACAAVCLVGLLLGEERGAREGRQLLRLVGWTAAATACLGIATANIVLMLLGGFIAAAMFGRFIPVRR